MTEHSDRIQALMDEVYGVWQKDENRSKNKWDILTGFSPAHQIAVVFGNFNYQVENGGISQWIYNRYFHDDADKLIEYLELGAKSDERCVAILDKIHTLDQYANETDCDQDGYYVDSDYEDGEGGFIGDLINGEKFDTWYYGHCGEEDWWKTVCDIIDKTEEITRDSVAEDAPLITGDCVPGSLGMDLKDKVVAIRPDALLPEYRAGTHQLLLAMGGFGCAPGSRGRAVFGTNIYSGEQERWDRSDILGVVRDNALPGWAREKLARLREPREKESVIAKIREAKETPAPQRPESTPKKSHEPEI